MKLDISYNEFCTRYYSVAVQQADVILAKHIKKTGTLHRYMDLDYVKQICVSYALEKVYKNYDVDHEKGASVETYMSGIVHNCLMTELGKEWTSVKRAHPKKVQLKRTKSKDTVDTNVSEGVPTCGTITSGPSEGSDIVATRVYERKEKVIERMMECIKKLQMTDQIILDCWLNERRGYVNKALERLGFEVTVQSQGMIRRRLDLAKDRLAKMMGGTKPDYRDVYIPRGEFRHEAVEEVAVDRNLERRRSRAIKQTLDAQINYTVLTNKLYKEFTK